MKIIGHYSNNVMKKRLTKRKNKPPDSQRLTHYKENSKLNKKTLLSNYTKFSNVNGFKIGCYNIYYNRIVRGDNYKKGSRINPKVSFHHIKTLLKNCNFDILCLQEVIFGDNVNKSYYPDKDKHFKKEGKYWKRKDNGYFGKPGHLGIRGGDFSKTEKEYKMFCKWLHQNNYYFKENRPYSSFYDKSFGNMIIYRKDFKIIKELNKRSIINTDSTEPETRGFIILKFMYNNKCFTVCNTHLTEKPGNKQIIMIEKILNQKLMNDNTPTFICGDMNISNRNALPLEVKQFITKKGYPFLQDVNNFYSIFKKYKYTSIHDICKKNNCTIPTAWNSVPVDYIGGKNISSKNIKAIALFPSINNKNEGISDHDCIGMTVEIY